MYGKAYHKPINSFASFIQQGKSNLNYQNSRIFKDEFSDVCKASCSGTPLYRISAADSFVEMW